MAADIAGLFAGAPGLIPNASVLEFSDNARLAIQMEGKCGLNPLAQPGVAAQRGEVECPRHICTCGRLP
jgi:hypothetical protein